MLANNVNPIAIHCKCCNTKEKVDFSKPKHRPHHQHIKKQNRRGNNARN
nr:MAG TPA: hypothetical protein [Caudoviricetes sp.]